MGNKFLAAGLWQTSLLPQSGCTKTDPRIAKVTKSEKLGLLKSNQSCGFISDDFPNTRFPVRGFVIITATYSNPGQS